jgi:PST family polysaccharide transporter
MALSILIRMGVGLAVFVILARHLGPGDFGLVSGTFAYAGLVALLSDFGLPVKMLRGIAARPESGAALLAEGLVLKGVFISLTIVFGGGALLILPLDALGKLTCAVFAAGVLTGTVGDLAMVAYRATGHFARETVNVAWTSILYAATVAAIAALDGSGLLLGVGFFVSRILYAWLAIRGAFKLVPSTRISLPTTGSLLLSMRTSLSWAIDSGLGYLNGQLDVLVLPQTLGLAATGIYQSGSRFVLAVLALGAVLSNVHIPRLAASPATAGALRRELLICAEFAGLGLFFALALLLGGPFIVQGLLGRQYLEVNGLWPGFAAFVFARYAASGVGVLIVGLGRPRLRVGGQLVSLAVMVVGLAIWLPSHGLVAMPWVMTGGAATLLVIYGSGRIMLGRRSAS